jgi:hypothetical protein
MHKMVRGCYNIFMYIIIYVIIYKYITCVHLKRIGMTHNVTLKKDGPVKGYQKHLSHNRWAWWQGIRHMLSIIDGQVREYQIHLKGYQTQIC